MVYNLFNETVCNIYTGTGKGEGDGEGDGEGVAE